MTKRQELQNELNSTRSDQAVSIPSPWPQITEMEYETAIEPIETIRSGSKSNVNVSVITECTATKIPTHRMTKRCDTQSEPTSTRGVRAVKQQKRKTERQSNRQGEESTYVLFPSRLTV